MVRADSLITPTSLVEVLQQQQAESFTTSLINRANGDDTVVPASIDDAQDSVTWDPASFKWRLALGLTTFVVGPHSCAETDQPPEVSAPQEWIPRKPWHSSSRATR